MSDKYIIDAEQYEKAAPVRGRPSLYTPELAQEICDRLSKGEPLAKICRDEHMPSVRTVGNWKLSDEDFSSSIAHAREEGEDNIAADCMGIADDSSGDYTEGENGPIYNAEHVQRSKLRIETRLKLLAKWNPKKYGDKITQEHTGANGGAIRVENMSDEQLMQIAARAGTKAPE